MQTVATLFRERKRATMPTWVSGSPSQLALNWQHPLAKYVKSCWPMMEGSSPGTGQMVHDIGPNQQHRTSLGTLSWGSRLSAQAPVFPDTMNLVSGAIGQNINLGDHDTFDGQKDFAWFFWFRPGISDSAGTTILSKQGGGNDSFLLEWSANENWRWDVKSAAIAHQIDLSPAIGSNSLHRWILVVGQNNHIAERAEFSIVDSLGRLNHGTVSMAAEPANATAHSVVFGNIANSGYRMLTCLNGKTLSPREILELYHDPFGLLAPQAPPRRSARKPAALSIFGPWSQTPIPAVPAPAVVSY